MKYLSLILGILFLISFGYTFFENSETKEFLSFTVDIWMYQLIYFLIAISQFYFFYKRSNEQKKILKSNYI